jgi:hypothetical protein
MSSPRGLVVGGIGGIVVVVVVVVVDAARAGEGRVGDWGSEGRGKKKERGLSRSLERKDGLRTFRYILNDRRALLACGTYLNHRIKSSYTNNENTD